MVEVNGRFAMHESVPERPEWPSILLLRPPLNPMKRKTHHVWQGRTVIKQLNSHLALIIALVRTPQPKRLQQ